MMAIFLISFYPFLSILNAPGRVFMLIIKELNIRGKQIKIKFRAAKSLTRSPGDAGGPGWNWPVV
jgi:hypothetical protein